MTLKILVIEDHALVRSGIAQILRLMEQETEIHSAENGDQALDFLRASQDYDLILLDLALPGMDGFACLKHFRQHYPHISVVILSAFDEQITIDRAFASGAVGFIPKAYSGDELIQALRHVLAGNLFYPCQKILTPPKLDDERPKLPMSGLDIKDLGCTERQQEVLSLMIRGDSNRMIAEKLKISEGTVKIHVTAIFKYLGVSSRAQAIAVINQAIKPHDSHA
ncbi:MAG: response regulator transcription factor [Zoogloeaceae bacterium]|jgi:DNA-binding NarL/FixJ family response regulator|nr:response regulator transcription factor [Zoogloeaceae bacterium]